MAFEQETGSGSSTSNSYGSVAGFKDYWTDRGTDYTSETDATIQSWLIQATEYIDTKYRFKGYAISSDQALLWPRSGMYDKNDYPILTNVIPPELINATYQLAAHVTDGLFIPDDGVVSERIGPVSTTYSGKGTRYQVVDRLLYSFIKKGIGMERVK